MSGTDLAQGVLGGGAAIGAGLTAASAATIPIEEAIADHLVWLAAHVYAPSTVSGRRHHLVAMAAFFAEREVTDPATVTPSRLDSYQRHLFHHK